MGPYLDHIPKEDASGDALSYRRGDLLACVNRAPYTNFWCRAEPRSPVEGCRKCVAMFLGYRRSSNYPDQIWGEMMWFSWMGHVGQIDHTTPKVLNSSFRLLQPFSECIP